MQTYLRERIKEVLTGTSESIVVRIFGPDLDVLRDKADEVAETISDVDGHGSTWRRTSPRTYRRWKCSCAWPAARRYGLKPGDVRRQSSALLASEEVSDIF